jgi:hypothetical protein
MRIAVLLIVAATVGVLAQTATGPTFDVVSIKRHIQEPGPLGFITVQRTARLLVLGFELADHSHGLVVEGGEDLLGVLFRAMKTRPPTARSTTS